MICHVKQQRGKDLQWIVGASLQKQTATHSIWLIFDCFSSVFSPTNICWNFMHCSSKAKPQLTFSLSHWSEVALLQGGNGERFWKMGQVSQRPERYRKQHHVPPCTSHAAIEQIKTSFHLHVGILKQRWRLICACVWLCWAISKW